MTAPRRSARWFTYRTVVALVLLAGVAVSAISYRIGRIGERERAEAEFVHRATLRHALTREILGHYEDALFGLSALFVASEDITLAEFNEATARIEGRITGVQAFEWVPAVTQRERAALEKAMSAAYRGRRFEINEVGPTGERQPAAERAVYYPVTFVQPISGNESALGFDLMSGPTRDFLEHARETRQTVVTSPVRLVQESAPQRGVVMICPVYRAAHSGETGAGRRFNAGIFTGFLQCVFRVHDLLETAHSRQPDSVLDMLFIDASEKDPAKRVLYYRPANNAALREPMSEEEFRSAAPLEFNLPFGGREWRVLFRPVPAWMDAQYTSMPLLRSGGFVLLSALLAGIVLIIGRRTETIRRQVDERTAELAESRRQISSMLHALPGMAYRCTYDDHLNVLFLSEGALALTGWTAEDFIGGVAHFRDCIHPDDIGRVRDVTRAALEEQKDVEVEYRLRTRSGEEKWVLSRGRGVYADGGDLHMFEGLAIDITAQKNAEAARLTLERKLLESQKLESLGLLAGGIAHDFNNLLSSILGNAGLARLSLPDTSGVHEQLRAIEAASLRAAELCRQMLAYAGKGRFVIEPTDVTVLVEDLLPLLKISVAAHGTLRLALARNLPTVSADATQLRQIVMNLVLNAADAIAGRTGEIVLTTGVMHADPAVLASCVAGAGLPSGDYVFVEVRDNGCGMPPEVVAKIFDPFFTTKFAGRGLGLAAVLGIVRGHKGALQVRSTPGAGSAFRLLLPPGGSQPRTSALTLSGAPARWQHRGNVLLIEDEEPVRRVTGEILKSFGITPQLAADGPEGVELYRAQPDAIDVVMLDLLMPGMSGEQVLAALRAIRPDVRVLLVSGYSEGDILGRLSSSAGKLAFLAKPFTRDALERKLRDLLV